MNLVNNFCAIVIIAFLFPLFKAILKRQTRNTDLSNAAVMEYQNILKHVEKCNTTGQMFWIESRIKHFTEIVSRSLSKETRKEYLQDIANKKTLRYNYIMQRERVGLS